MADFTLQNKTAIITGGSSGIGEAIAKVFAKKGAKVHILDINEVETNSAIHQIVSNSGWARGHICDVSDQSAVKRTIQNIIKTDEIDILVNNAGIAQIGNVEQTSELEFDRIFSINVKGVYNMIKYCIPSMKRNGGGTIINMASIVASVGIPERFGYSMSKGAVLTMTLSVAKDYITDNIRCNSISPARVHTPLVDGYLAKTYPGKEKEIYAKLAKTQPIGRMAKPEEVANLALYLASDEASFITGTDYPIDGGFIRINN